MKIFETVINKLIDKICVGISQMIIYWGTGIICSKLLLNYGIKAMNNPKMMEAVGKILLSGGIQGSNLGIVNKVIEKSGVSDLPITAASNLIDSLNPFLSTISVPVIGNVVSGTVGVMSQVMNSVKETPVMTGGKVYENIHEIAGFGFIFGVVYKLVAIINPNLYEHIFAYFFKFKSILFAEVGEDGKESNYKNSGIIVRIIYGQLEALNCISVTDLVTVGLFMLLVGVGYKMWWFFREKYKNSNVIENE